MDQLLIWLNINQLEKYQQILIENDINTIELVAELSEEDLKELGFSMGDRKRFFIALKSIASSANISTISQEDQQLIDSLPYVIAYPLKETLLQNDYEKRLHRMGYTFINFLKYLGLISISEFFNSELKNRRIVDLFLSQLGEPSFGKWNAFIRESYTILKKEEVKLVFPEFYEYYIQLENKDKKHSISEEIIEDFGEVNYSKKNGISSIGMLINFRNKYLGHGTPINDTQAKELWEEYYPIFQNLLLKLSQLSEASLYKKENGVIWKLASTELTEEKEFHSSIDETRVWLTDNKDRKLSMVPFLIIPSDFGDLKNDSHLFVYESYTGKTLKFFSPESIVKETSGDILQRLNILLRDKQKEIPYSPDLFTKEAFLERISEENNIVLQTLINEKKVIPGVYQHREAMEIKLREWIGARSNIFFIAAEAGSGKTNLLVEIQKQYTERQLPSLLIRAARMEKKTLKEEIAYQLNIDVSISLEKYTAIAGTQAEPTFFLLDGLNEAENAEAIWREIIEISSFFEPGSIKFIITNRANGKDELERYIVSDEGQNLLYGENKDNEIGLGAFTFWLTALDMNEMKAAWESYTFIDKSKFKPNFTFDAIAGFDRGLYNQINNPLILRLFLEVYNGKSLPKKGGNHLNIWKDWFTTFTKEEQTFMRLLADEIWQKGTNELLFDDLIKSENLKAYFENDISKFPYDKLKKNGWISRYSKGLDSFIGFTVEGLLLYLLGVQLNEQKPKITIAFIENILETGTKLQKSAVRSYLKELAMKGDLDLITALIDKGNDLIDICIEPLVIYLKIHGIEKTIAQLLENPTENDWKALFKLDARLDDLELHLLRKDFLKELMPYNQLQTKDEVWLGLKAITLFDKEESLKYLFKIDTTKDFIQEDDDLLFQIGKSEHKFGNYDKALEYYEKSLAIRLKTIGENHVDVATSYNNIGLVWQSKGNYDKAIEYYEKSLAIKLKTIGENHTDVATSYNNIGLVWDSKGNYDKALEYHEKSLAILLKTIGENHADVATSYNNIGLVWKSKGNYDRALEYYEKSLAIRLKTIGENHSSVATTYGNIGQVWKSKGSYDKSLEYYEKSLAIKLKTIGENHNSVATTYGYIGGVWQSKGSYDKSLEYHEKSLAIFLKTIGENHFSVATTYGCIGGVWQSKGSYDKSLEYYEKSLAIKLKTIGENHSSVATTYNNIGLVWKSKGNLDKALEYYEKSLAIDLKTIGENHSSVATTYGNIGGVWQSKGSYDKSLEYHEKSLAIFLKTIGENHNSVATAYGNIGQVWQSKGSYDKSLEYFEKSLAIFLKTIGENHSSVATSYGDIGLVWKSKGNYDKALEYYEKSLVIKLKTIGDNHTDVASSYNNIGLVWQSKGNYDKALEYYEKSLAIRLKTLGENHASVATSYNNIGSIWQLKGNYDKALEYYEKCLSIQLKTLGENHASVATSYNNIGGIWDSKGNYDKALEYYEKSLAIRLKTLGENHASVATSYNNIGLVWRSKGNYDKALEYYEKCLSIYLKTLGENHASVATSYINIGGIWQSKSNYHKAIENFQKGYKILAKGGFPFKIAQCYEELNDKKNALDYYIQSAEIRKEDPEVGLEAESTQEAISNAKRLAKELAKENDLPEWIKNIN